MSDVLTKLGIKQTIQKTWMDKSVHMLLSGMNEKDIRAELDHYLSTQKQSGGIGQREGVTYRMAIGLLASWFSPAQHLVAFRDDALSLAKVINESQWTPLHWAVISASYPFWHYVAKQTGRLFNLQDKVTQAQIFQRLKEQYGDRETVARNARYTVRSFVAWGALKDSESKGCYESGGEIAIPDLRIMALLYESTLYCQPNGKLALGLLQNNPAFFPFGLRSVSGELLAQNNARVMVNRYGMEDEQLSLKVNNG